MDLKNGVMVAWVKILVSKKYTISTKTLWSIYGGSR